MDNRQAQAIASLSMKPEWQSLEGYINETLAKLHEDMETFNPERLQTMQGQCVALRSILNLPEKAYDLINR